MIVDHLTKELRHLRKILEVIEAFGYANPGHGFSCARMASLGLGKEPKGKKKEQESNKQCPSASSVATSSLKPVPLSKTKVGTTTELASTTEHPDETSP